MLRFVINHAILSPDIIDERTALQVKIGLIKKIQTQFFLEICQFEVQRNDRNSYKKYGC